MIVSLLLFLSRGSLNLKLVYVSFRASNKPDPNKYQVSCRLLVWEGLQLKVYEQKKADVL